MVHSSCLSFSCSTVVTTFLEIKSATDNSLFVTNR
nr:MAG TPA: hypothetical protein [Caudoviricetes sp.]